MLIHCIGIGCVDILSLSDLVGLRSISIRY
jgi:hypothetical protein